MVGLNPGCGHHGSTYFRGFLFPPSLYITSNPLQFSIHDIKPFFFWPACLRRTLIPCSRKLGRTPMQKHISVERPLVQFFRAFQAYESFPLVQFFRAFQAYESFRQIASWGQWHGRWGETKAKPLLPWFVMCIQERDAPAGREDPRPVDAKQVEAHVFLL